MVSKKADAYAGDPKRLLVVASFGGALTGRVDGDQVAAFNATFVDALRKCGTESEIQVKNAIFLGDDVQQRVRQFRPDSILEINWQNAVQNRGITISAVYAVTLTDLKSKAIVWKAGVDFQSRWEAGKTLAQTILTRMKQDGIIDASCATGLVT